MREDVIMAKAMAALY